MPRGKGGKPRSNRRVVTTSFFEKENGQEYAFVTKTLGNCRFELEMNHTGTLRQGKLRGSMTRRRKQNNVAIGGVVLVSERDFHADGTVDIIGVYTPSQISKLIHSGTLVKFEKNKVDDSVLFFNEEEENEEQKKVKQRKKVVGGQMISNVDISDNDEVDDDQIGQVSRTVEDFDIDDI